jgi:hypothetical protein
VRQKGKAETELFTFKYTHIMLDFITVPLVVGLCVAGTYGLFELFVRRKERLVLIEKLSDKLDTSAINGKAGFFNLLPKFSFSALKFGCLLCGTGLGLLIGFIIHLSVLNADLVRDNWHEREVVATAYGASVLLFGGLALIIAFLIELKQSKRIEN